VPGLHLDSMCYRWGSVMTSTISRTAVGNDKRFITLSYALEP
jgi:hypothetical protein